MLFVITLYTQNDIFKYVKKKYGQDIISYMITRKNAKKLSADINYIKTCKKERLIPPFARLNISLKKALVLNSNRKLLLQLWKLKYKLNIPKNKVEKGIKADAYYTEKKFEIIIFNTVFRQLKIYFKRKFKVIANCHHKKVTNLDKTTKK